MKKTMVRQGDVFLIAVDEAPGETTPAPKDPRGVVLAEGETSGHFHGVVGKAKLFHFRDGRGDRLLVVGDGGAEVRVFGGGSGGVDRHTPISLEPGKYLVRVQRSWTVGQYSAQVQD